MYYKHSFNTHFYKLAFANSAMTVAHKVSEARKPISGKTTTIDNIKAKKACKSDNYVSGN